MKNWMWATISIVIIIIAGAWYYTRTAEAPTQDTSAEMTFGTYAYECDEHVVFTMTPSADMNTISIAPSGAGTYPPATTLSKVSASSGVRYEGGGLVFVGQGESVAISEGEQSLNCSPVETGEAPFNFGD